MFKADGPEAAAVYLHMADLLWRLDPYDLSDARIPRGRGSLWREIYRDQPPEIAAAAPKNDEGFRRALDPEWLFRRAADLAPDTDTFQLWLAWSYRTKVPDKYIEDLAKFWRQKLPG